MTLCDTPGSPVNSLRTTCIKHIMRWFGKWSLSPVFFTSFKGFNIGTKYMLFSRDKNTVNNGLHITTMNGQSIESINILVTAWIKNFKFHIHTLVSKLPHKFLHLDSVYNWAILLKTILFLYFLYIMLIYLSYFILYLCFTVYFCSFSMSPFQSCRLKQLSAPSMRSVLSYLYHST